MNNIIQTISSIFKRDDNGEGILKDPGDRIVARVSKTGRQIVTVRTSQKGNYSATRYKNGTIVETKTTRKQQ